MSYVAAVAILLFGLLPILVPAAVSAVHAVSEARKRNGAGVPWLPEPAVRR